jgi:competence protein ComEA
MFIKHIMAAVLALSAAGAFAAVDINQANLAELEAVKGVGTRMAGKIIEERRNGAFHDWSDVMQRVKGVKESKAGKLSAAGLTVNGDSYHAPAKLDTPASKVKGAKKTSKKGDAAEPKAARS